jgi:hypothetical protein
MFEAVVLQPTYSSEGLTYAANLPGDSAVMVETLEGRTRLEPSMPEKFLLATMLYVE